MGVWAALDCRTFYEQLEVLLDEGVLVGRGRACMGELRPLAFSMLAELIHHVRQELKLPQLVRIIYLFSRCADLSVAHGKSLLAPASCTCDAVAAVLISARIWSRVFHIIEGMHFLTCSQSIKTAQHYQSSRHAEWT